MMEDSKIYFIDTNIFLRVLVRENETILKECVAVLELIKNGIIKAFTCNLVLAEIDWVMERIYKISKKEVVKDLKSITKLKNLKFYDDNDALLGIYLYEKHNVKFIDGLIAANHLIQKNNAIIISYDKDFDKLGIKRIEPKKLLKSY